jgi:hypothetical protein
MRSHLFVMKQMQNQRKYSTTWLLNALLANIEFPYLAEKHFLYTHISTVNTAAVAPYSNPHCTLTPILTVHSQPYI